MSNMKDCDYDETSEDDSGDEEQIATKEPIKNIVIKEPKDKMVIPIAREWTAFMAHIPHADAEYIKQDLERLETKFIMGLEVSSYEHIHFLAKMTTKEYSAFSKKNFIDKYKLRGRAIAGKPRQYGKEKNIRDIEKYSKYCLKDQNFLTNMTKAEIEEIIKMKIEDVKNTKGKNANSDLLKDELIQYMEKHLTQRAPNPNKSMWMYTERWNHYHRLLKIHIVDFMKTKQLSIRRSTIDMYFYHVTAYSEKHLKMTSADIIDSLYTSQLM